MGAGRPSAYTTELADAICLRLAEGESLRSICSEEGMPSQSMVYRWVHQHHEFREKYARARESQMERMADEILEIADDGSNDTYETEEGEKINQDVINRSRLRVDARKWIMSKLAPKKYGDKQTTALTDADGGKLNVVLNVIRSGGESTTSPETDSSS